jgi:PIN domain nuclease of toxin-antitoxin system
MTIEPIYVADTNALYWYLTSDKHLKPTAAEIFAAAERGETEIVLSVIVMAELFHMLRKKTLQEDFATIYAAIKRKPYFRLVSFRPDDVLDFERDRAIPEMHDRIIVGLARRLDAPMITSDSIITASGLVRIAW